jgi:hypothetical protein
MLPRPGAPGWRAHPSSACACAKNAFQAWPRRRHLHSTHDPHAKALRAPPVRMQQPRDRLRRGARSQIGKCGDDRMKREPGMRHALIVATLAALLGGNAAVAQTAGMSATFDAGLGMGQTSPLGAMGSASAVGTSGIPLGAAELGSTGMSPLPSGTDCTAMGSSTSGASGSTPLFDGGGSGGMAVSGSAPSSGGCASGLASGSSASFSLGGMASGGLVGRTGNPMGATQLGSGGLSPAPVVGAFVPSSPITTMGSTAASSSMSTIGNPFGSSPISTMGSPIPSPMSTSVSNIPCSGATRSTGTTSSSGTGTNSVGCQ